MSVEKDLEDAAKREDWNYIDSTVPNVSGNKNVIETAYKNWINDQDSNVRDLSMTVLEVAKMDEEEFCQIRDKVADRMLHDPSHIVKYRAAFTLAAHGAGRYKDTVKQTIEEASSDPDVGGRAKKYQTAD